MTRSEVDVVVVGAGLGGLSAAAHLARAGFDVALFERAPDVGGKCITRRFEDARFAVGANLFGSRILRVLKRLDVPVASIPAPFRIALGDARVDFPFRPSLVAAMRSLGIGPGQLAAMFWRLGRAFRASSDNAPTTYRDLLERAVDNPSVRELFYAEAWLLGTRPERLPSSYFRMFFGTHYGYHQPFYPAAGAQAIPLAFQRAIEAAGSRVETGREVRAIVVEAGRAVGVQLADEVVTARVAVVSNAELADTFALLQGTSDQPVIEARAQIDAYPSSFPFAALLLKIKPRDKLFPRNAPTSTLLLDQPVDEAFSELERGNLPAAPIMNVVAVETATQLRLDSPSTVSVLTLWPRAWIGTEARRAFMDKAFARLERFDPWLVKSLLWSRLITPDEYPAVCGFSSCPAPLLDTPARTKPGSALPVADLYNVGTTVLPIGSHTGTAVESGESCARAIITSAAATRRVWR